MNRDQSDHVAWRSSRGRSRVYDDERSKREYMTRVFIMVLKPPGLSILVPILLMSIQYRQP